MLGVEITRRYGGTACRTTRSASTSPARRVRASARSCRAGITLTLEGDANDYCGKGLSGGKLVVYPPRDVDLRRRGERHHRQRRAVRRDQRRGVLARRGRRALRGAQQRRDGGRRGRRRSRLRVHDRRTRRRARPHGPELRRRHERRHRIRARHRRNVPAPLQPGNGRARAASSSRRTSTSSGRMLERHVALHGQRPRRAAAGGLGGRCARDSSRSCRREYKRVLVAEARARSENREPAVAERSERRMGNTTGFLEIERAKPRERPVRRARARLAARSTCRQHESDSARSGRALHGLRHSVLPPGLPARQYHPGMERPRLPARWQEASESAARHEQLSPSSPAVSVRRRAKGRACSASTTSAVTIKNIELAIVERAFAKGWIRARAARRRTGKRVAVVGSGPAGLAAAEQLDRAGHGVTVFERADRIGGLLRYGIPDFKMEKRVLDRRLAQIADEGVVFRTGVHVGVDVSAAYAPRSEFDASCCSRRREQPRDLNVPGRELEASTSPMDFLPQQNRRARATTCRSRGDLSPPASASSSSAAATREPTVWARCTGRGRCVRASVRAAAAAPGVRAATTPGPSGRTCSARRRRTRRAASGVFSISTERFVGDERGNVRGARGGRSRDGARSEGGRGFERIAGTRIRAARGSRAAGDGIRRPRARGRGLGARRCV